MLRNIFTEQFNEKYAGKELMFCNKVYEDILFYPDRISKCCHCTRMPYSPPDFYTKPIKYFILGAFSINSYIYLEYLLLKSSRSSI